MTEYEKQHPISAFYLRNFADANGDIGVLYMIDDVRNGHLVRKAPYIEYKKGSGARPFWKKNIWSKRFEKQLGTHESDIKPILEALLTSNGSDPIPYRDMLDVILYVSMLNFRSLKFVDKFLPVAEQKLEKKLSLEERADFIMESVKTYGQCLAPGFGCIDFNKEVIITSDSPVIFDDANIFASQHMYLPISPTRLLQFDANGITSELSNKSLIQNGLDYRAFNLQTLLFAHEKIYFKPGLDSEILQSLEDIVRTKNTNQT